MLGIVLTSIGFVAGLGLATSICLAQDPAPEPTQLSDVIVTRAIDGDSLDARVDTFRTALGYLGVETPALNEPCGREALARNMELAADHILVEPDPMYEFDERGRRLFYAYTLDGVWIDEMLIREGLGFAIRTDTARGAHLAQVQAEAELDGVGCLWGGGSNSATPSTASE
jgi:endonuclease YncB( thermonuclease family)